MKFQIVAILYLFSSTNAVVRYNNEFNRNLYDDNMELEFEDIDSYDENPNNGLEHFFRQIRSLEEEYKNTETIDTEEYTRKISKRDFLDKLQELNDMLPDNERRNKRSAENHNSEIEDKKQRLVDRDEKPLEVIVLNIDNSTEESTVNDENLDEPLKINDFLRFKRDLEKENFTGADEDDKLRPKREKDEKDNKRDSSTKEQWIKQPYPVIRQVENKYDDNLRAPQVNFVTQRRYPYSPPPINHQFGEYPSQEYNTGYYARYPRHYDPYQRNYHRDEYANPSNSYEHDNYYNERPVYRQRRVIYYTTLPEVVRSPSNRDYNYRDPYGEMSDNRYGRLPLENLPPRIDPYRYRKPYYPVDKPAYDENVPVKGAYPLKVSTDVNVKEIKKSPERRNFPEGDPRYNSYGHYQGGFRYDPLS